MRTQRFQDTLELYSAGASKHKRTLDWPYSQAQKFSGPSYTGQASRTDAAAAPRLSLSGDGAVTVENETLRSLPIWRASILTASEMMHAISAHAMVGATALFVPNDVEPFHHSQPQTPGALPLHYSAATRRHPLIGSTD
jgi:hypothetical protein